MNLSNLKNKEKGKIISIEAKGEIRRRLLDMGLVKGTIVEVIRRAPLGDPIEIKIKKFNLSLRREEAKTILIKQINEK